MMKFLIVFLAIFLYSAPINTKIYVTKKVLHRTKTKISNMSVELDSIIRKINKSAYKLEQTNSQINKVNIKIKQLSDKLSKNNQNLTSLENNQTSLLEKKMVLQGEVIKFISENYCLENKNIETTQDLIDAEILKSVIQQSSKKMGKILAKYKQLDSKINKLNNIITQIRSNQQELIKKKQELSKLKRIQQKNIAQLQQIKLKYKKALQQTIYSQSRLQRQLEQLKIIQKKELLAKRKERERELRAERKINKNSNFSKIDKMRIKKYYNGVYMKGRTIRYRGPKTIPPVHGVIVRKFGTYIDPVYKITVYNDTILIKTKPNAIVRSILSGRVVFAGKDSVEDQMIVIQHRNHLYSVYARLSKLSPFIKKGYYVKKGEIIAKTSGELEFEVTYRTLPINPLSVCKF